MTGGVLHSLRVEIMDDWIMDAVSQLFSPALSAPALEIVSLSESPPDTVHYPFSVTVTTLSHSPQYFLSSKMRDKVGAHFPNPHTHTHTHTHTHYGGEKANLRIK